MAVSESRMIRQRQATLAEDIDLISREQEPSIAAFPVELVKVDGKWPADGPGTQVYMARHILLIGLDVPGTTLTVNKTGSPFRVANLGNGTPPDPDLGVPTRTIIVERAFRYDTFLWPLLMVLLGGLA